MEDGEVIVFGIVRDVTDRKQREREIQELNARLEQRVAERTADLQAALDRLQRTQHELLQSEKLASLGALVAGVAHELNTPIGNAVTVSSSLTDAHRRITEQLATGLTKRTLNDFLQDVGEGSQIIERNLSRAAELISGFKQLAVDQTSYQRRAFGLREVVHEVLLAMKPTLRYSRVVVQDDIADGLVLDSYPGPLGQIVMNLINNALIHAFGALGEGHVRLQAEATEPGWLRLSVTDDGVGMSPAILKRIFDPFYTTRLGQGGSGLGLHIVYTLTTGILGGRIEVHSEPGKGAVFELHLPLNAPTDTTPEGAKP